MKTDKKGNKTVEKGLKTVSKERILKISPKRLKMINDTIKALISTPNKTRASEMLGISDVALYKRLNKYPEIENGVKSFIDSVLEDGRRRIELRTDQTIRNIEQYADNAQSENVGLQANLELLDRAGITKPNTNNIQVNILNDLKKLKDIYN